MITSHGMIGRWGKLMIVLAVTSPTKILDDQGSPFTPRYATVTWERTEEIARWTVTHWVVNDRSGKTWRSGKSVKDAPDGFEEIFTDSEPRHL